MALRFSIRRLVGLVVGVVLPTLFAACIWLLVPGALDFPTRHPAFYPAVLGALGVLVLTLAGVLWLELQSLRRDWLQRTAHLASLQWLEPPGLLQLLRARVPDPIGWLSRPLLNTRAGRRLQRDWTESGLEGSTSRYVVLLLGAASTGLLVGMRIGGLLLGLPFALVLSILLRALVSERAQAARRTFSDQLPRLLDLIASGMAAGMSFQGSVAFCLGELPDPANQLATRLSARLALGWPVEEVFSRLDHDYEDEGLHLAIEGIVLQRQFGGDMVRMLQEVSDLLRERIELEREVRAVSTQGRLSGLVIAALVPASAAFLLTFNPGYIDILFETVPGQILVILTMALQLAGWAVISRLVRIRY